VNPFLSHLIAHGQGRPPAIEPRLPGRFETPAYFEEDRAGEVAEYPQQEAPRASDPAAEPASPPARAARAPAQAEIPPPVQPSSEPADPHAPQPPSREKHSRAEGQEPQASPSPVQRQQPSPPLEPPQAWLLEPPRQPGVRVTVRLEGAENPLLPPVTPQPIGPLTQRPEFSEVEPDGLEPPRPGALLEAPPAPRPIDAELSSSPLPAPRAPTIQVHIGRIEVRALFNPPPESPQPKAPLRGLSLEEFLRRRR
jgi:hypothetical protein